MVIIGNFSLDDQVQIPSLDHPLLLRQLRVRLHVRAVHEIAQQSEAPVLHWIHIVDELDDLSVRSRSLLNLHQLRNLVVALTPKVLNSREELKARELSSALFGLQRLGNSAEVRALVAAMALKVHGCQEELRVSYLCIALYGLQSLQDSEESRQLVAALCLLGSSMTS